MRGRRWAVLVLPVVFIGGDVPRSRCPEARRDLGAGALAGAARPTAPPRLVAAGASPGGSTAACSSGWAIGFVLVGALVGSLAADVADFANNASAATCSPGSVADGLIDAYLALSSRWRGWSRRHSGSRWCCAIRSEEVAGRAEPVLATAVSRVRWAASHLVMAFGGLAVLLALGGAGPASPRVRTDDVGRVHGGRLAQWPAARLAAAITWPFGLVPTVACSAGRCLVFVLIGELGRCWTWGRGCRTSRRSATRRTCRGAGRAGTVRRLPVSRSRGRGLAGFRRRDVRLRGTGAGGAGSALIASADASRRSRRDQAPARPDGQPAVGVNGVAFGGRRVLQRRRRRLIAADVPKAQGSGVDDVCVQFDMTTLAVEGMRWWCSRRRTCFDRRTGRHLDELQ